MKMKILAAAVAVCGAVVASTASAATISVSWIGTTSGNAGGPYSVNGGFKFDSSVVGASADLSMVSIDDLGISNFSFSVTGGLYDQTFTDNTAIAGARSGSFDLSALGTFSDIINSPICIEGSGGDGTCSISNSGGAFYIANRGASQFSPDDNASYTRLRPMTYTVSPIPVPASLPLLAAGLVGLGFMARRKRKSA